MYSQNALNLGHLLSWASGYCRCCEAKVDAWECPSNCKRDIFFHKEIFNHWFSNDIYLSKHQKFRWYIGRFQGAINKSISFRESDIIPSRHGDDISHQSGRSIDLLYCQLASWELKTPFPVAFLNIGCHFSSYLEQILCDFRSYIGNTHPLFFPSAETTSLEKKQDGWHYNLNKIHSNYDSYLSELGSKTK